MWKALIKLVEKWACMHDMELIKDILVIDDLFGTYHKYCLSVANVAKLYGLIRSS